MSERLRGLPILGLTLAFVLALGGCDQEGPAEQAGEKVDRAVENTGDAIEKKTD